MTYRLRNVAIAIGLALVAMLLTLFYVVNYRRSVQHAQATVQVYVAKRNINPGTAGSDIAHGNGLPAISIPNGLADGLPTGFQIAGPAFSENRILDAAHALEGAIGFDGSRARG